MSTLEPKQAKTNEKLTETWDMISYAEWPEMWFIHFYKIVSDKTVWAVDLDYKIDYKAWGCPHLYKTNFHTSLNKVNFTSDELI